MLFYFPPHRTYVHIYVRVYGCLCLLLVFLEERRADKKHFVFKFHWMRHCMQIFRSWFFGGHFVTVYRTHTATMSVSRSAAARVNKNRVYYYFILVIFHFNSFWFDEAERKCLRFILNMIFIIIACTMYVHIVPYAFVSPKEVNLHMRSSLIWLWIGMAKESCAGNASPLVNNCRCVCVRAHKASFIARKICFLLSVV